MFPFSVEGSRRRSIISNQCAMSLSAEVRALKRDEQLTRWLVTAGSRPAMNASSAFLAFAPEARC
jgi:hypothetical protein